MNDIKLKIFRKIFLIIFVVISILFAFYAGGQYHSSWMRSSLHSHSETICINEHVYYHSDREHLAIRLGDDGKPIKCIPNIGNKNYTQNH